MSPERAASFLLRRFRIPNEQSEPEMHVAPAFGRLLERAFRGPREQHGPASPKPNPYRATLDEMFAEGRRRDERNADRSLRP